MATPVARRISVSLVVLVAACGKPVDPSGQPAEFIKASMGGEAGPRSPERPLAADLAVEPVSMLVMFNRLKTPEKLQEALNLKAGRFSHLDLDNDLKPDPLTVATRPIPDGHAFEIRVRPTNGEFVVATMVFDPDWTYLGHYSGLKGGASSTYGRPLIAEPLAGTPALAVPATSTSTDAAAPTPAAAPASTGTVPGAPVGAPASAGTVPGAPVGSPASAGTVPAVGAGAGTVPAPTGAP